MAANAMRPAPAASAIVQMAANCRSPGPAPQANTMPLYDKDPLTAMEAVSAAQWLAFAPLAFHATAAMRDRGVLQALADAGEAGCSIEEIAATTGLSQYAARVLAEAGLGL